MYIYIHIISYHIYIYHNIKTLSKSVQHGSPKRASHTVPYVMLHIRKFMMNDDDHDLSRVHSFNTECVCNESHNYVTPLFTVTLPVGWPNWQIPSRASQEGSIEMNSNIENGSNQIETQTAWSPNISLSLPWCYLYEYDFTHLIVSIVLPDLHK